MRATKSKAAKPAPSAKRSEKAKPRLTLVRAKKAAQAVKESRPSEEALAELLQKSAWKKGGKEWERFLGHFGS
jgi:hypothetical protein